MQLADVLTLPTFQKAVVIAGHEGLPSTVQSVKVINSLAVVDELQKEQLLLKNYSMIGNPKPLALVTLMKQMANQGCAGLVLQTEQINIGKLSKKIIDEANRLNLPIIEIPYTISIDNMLNELLEYLKETTQDLHYALTIHKEFMNIIISGGGFTNIIENLSAILKIPVVLLNYRFEIMASTKNIDKDSFFDIYSYIYENSQLEEIEHDQLITLYYEQEDHPFCVFSLYPVHSTNEQNGYIVLLGSSVSSLLAVEQAANVISFEFMKLYAIEQEARRMKNEFFIDLVDGSITSPEEISNRGKKYHLNKQLQYVCITCKNDRISDFYTSPFPLQIEKEIRKQHNRTYEILETIIKNQFENSIIFTKGDVFTLLLGFEFYNEEVEFKLLETIKQIQEDIERLIDITLSFGVSNYVESLKDIPTAYKESIDAIRSGYRENRLKFIKTYRTKEVVEILKTIPYQKLKDFYETSLKMLANPSDKEAEDLVETLSAYLNCHCQISETAKVLFIHRNTVIYRIKKCEDLLTIDLKKPDETLRLRIAFQIKTLLKDF